METLGHLGGEAQLVEHFDGKHVCYAPHTSIFGFGTGFISGYGSLASDRVAAHF